jgi:hypothetical protein
MYALGVTTEETIRTLKLMKNWKRFVFISKKKKVQSPAWTISVCRTATLTSGVLIPTLPKTE